MIQDYEDYELIFQDDSSENYDVDKIKGLMPDEFREKHGVRFFHNEKNVGTVRNLNMGIHKANGVIVMPMAADDYLYGPHVFSKFMNEFEKKSCNICCCSIVQEKSKRVLPTKKDLEMIKNGTQRELLDRLYASNCIIGALLTLRKSFFLEKNLFDTRFVLVEDYPTFLKIIKEGERINFINEVCLVHGEDGISNRFSTLFNKNKIATKDSKLIKDLYVMPYLSEVSNKTIRRYIAACYYLRYHSNRKQFILKFIQYIDIWIKVLLYHVKSYFSKSNDGIYYYLERK